MHTHGRLRVHSGGQTPVWTSACGPGPQTECKIPGSALRIQVLRVPAGVHLGADPFIIIICAFAGACGCGTVCILLGFALQYAHPLVSRADPGQCPAVMRSPGFARGRPRVLQGPQLGLVLHISLVLQLPFPLLFVFLLVSFPSSSSNEEEDV